MQYWPRKRAKRETPRVRARVTPTAGVHEFAGYKAGMTHAIILDNRKHSLTKGEEISIPVTILEVPPLFVYGVRAYKRTESGMLRAIGEKVVKAPRMLARRGTLAKKPSEKALPEADAYRLLVSTHPEKTGIGKKTGELFEIALGGTPEEQRATAEDLLGKDLAVEDVFKPGDIVDVHAVTKGKGTQGPVKRFGITLKSHKSEKGRRRPGNLGPWTGARQYRVALAGQTGYHLRTEWNKQIIAILKPEEVQVRGGIPHYGVVRNTVLLLAGSIPGPKKRLVRLTRAQRAYRKAFPEAPRIVHLSTHSQQ